MNKLKNDLTIAKLALSDNNQKYIGLLKYANDTEKDLFSFAYSLGYENARLEIYAKELDSQLINRGTTDHE